MECCEDLPKIKLKIGNDDDISVDLSEPSIDFTPWTVTASVDYLYGDGSNLFIPVVTVDSQVLGSMETYVSFSSAQIQLLKGQEILTVAFDNGSGKIKNLRFLLTKCL